MLSNSRPLFAINEHKIPLCEHQTTNRRHLLGSQGADFLLGSGLSLKSCFLVRKSYKDWHGKPFPMRRVCTACCAWAHSAAQMRFSTFEREVRLSIYLPFMCSVGSDKRHLEGHFFGHECLSYWWASTSRYKAEPVVCLLLSFSKKETALDFTS